MTNYEKLHWTPIAEKAPPEDWPIFVKGRTSDGAEIYAVLQWYKPSQEGHPGFFSPMCNEALCEKTSDHDMLNITPTHWLDVLA